MIKRTLVALAALALASFALAACGSSSSDSSSSSTPSEPTSTAPETTSSSAAGGGAGSTIDIAADPSGALAYEQTDVTAPAGKDTIDFTNDSSTPHNVMVEDADGNIIGGTDTIQADTATATVDLKPGTYTFFCSIPGHEAAGMKGTIEVK